MDHILKSMSSATLAFHLVLFNDISIAFQAPNHDCPSLICQFPISILVCCITNSLHCTLLPLSPIILLTLALWVICHLIWHGFHKKQSVFMPNGSCFYNHLPSNKSMYCDYRLYLPVQSPHTTQTPSGLCSNQLCSSTQNIYIVLSAALKRKFGDYLKTKIDSALKRPQKKIENFDNSKKCKTIIIDQESDVEPQQKYQQKDVEVQLMEDIRPVPKDHEVNSQTSAQVQKEQQFKQNQQRKENTIILQKANSVSLGNDHVDKEISCPRMCLDYLEMQIKKQNLLSRRVDNWSQVPMKGVKQRRELRMLGH